MRKDKGLRERRQGVQGEGEERGKGLNTGRAGGKEVWDGGNKKKVEENGNLERNKGKRSRRK